MTPQEAQAQNEELQRAYQLTFAGPSGKRVLVDLVAFCFGRRSTSGADALQTAENNGKREVLLRVMEFTNLSLEEIYQLRGIGRVRQPGDDQ